MDRLSEWVRYTMLTPSIFQHYMLREELIGSWWLAYQYHPDYGDGSKAHFAVYVARNGKQPLYRLIQETSWGWGQDNTHQTRSEVDTAFERYHQILTNYENLKKLHPCETTMSF